MPKMKKDVKKAIRKQTVAENKQGKDFKKEKRKLGTKLGLKKKSTTNTDLTLHSKGNFFVLCHHLTF